jgi:Mycothiol maleylpyruvate isomerase N-terminal domain
MVRTASLTRETIPEWEAFHDAMTTRSPDHGTACEAWTVRDIVAHQAGTAEELARILRAHLDGENVPPTRSFEEREPRYRSLEDTALERELAERINELAVVAERAMELDPDALVPWTGRHMRVRWFAEHMREELVIHRWDIVGDDEVSLRLLGERWFTEHSVVAVGRPLLMRGYERWAGGQPFAARLRAPDEDDVIVSATYDGPSIELGPPQGDAVVESDAAARALLLWGRQPADPSRIRSDSGPAALGAARRLLAGY